ncbi:hypothetical protein EF294_11650 [Gordonia oryzae]|uniref:ATP-binding protein n=1 Tax=Gordonia oryzae TaxID=2487349 RepID=A0A3N4GAT0_9ACTN|nr:hypothetical protein [Gordonia oryzae]RPA59903.1 hypothetical protein EF294_11650 [Gordonia oryzae]
MHTDPFGTADLATSTLSAWRNSPTRLAEDVAAEDDLASVGYRDRLFVELVTNAADAARLGGVEGEVAIWSDVDDLHVANTGAPLTEAGVRSLLALRVSAKRPDGTGGVIGRFGVGFSATAAVAHTIEIRSTTGTIRFDRARAAAAVAEAGIVDAARVPLLRLAWPGKGVPRAGFATEIVLGLVEGLDPQAILDAAAAQAPDLLLALTALRLITVEDNAFEIDRTDLVNDELSSGSRVRRLTVTVTGRDDRRSRDFAEIEHGPSRWLRADDGRPVSAGADASAADVLWAPTPTDIELSLPCRLIARLPLTQDRRHVHPDADIAAAAAGYVDVLRLAEPGDGVALVPRAHRARNGDDARLIDAVLGELRRTAWLPGIAGVPLVPEGASVLIGLDPDLAEVLGELFTDLVHPDLSLAHQLPVLESLGVSRIGLALLAERLTGVDRDPAWWGRLYAALAPLVSTTLDAEELAALPIPRSDGRMNIGARGLFTAHAVQTPLRWIRTVAAEADHPLLERLGVQRLSITDALADPALRVLVEEAADLVEDGAGEEVDATGLAEEVLALLGAGTDTDVPGWLSRLPLPADDGDLRSADEMLLADSPLAAVLVEDHPFGLLDTDVAERHSVQVLRRLGVGWSFAVIGDELPTGPDHDLPDEEQWWETLPDPPERLCAIRDLDLVDPARWERALTLIVEDEQAARALDDREGYTAWWLRHFAEVDGALLGEYRAPSDHSLVGVLDPLEHPHADALAPAVAALPPESATQASLLLARLGDRARSISPGVARGIYSAVAEVCRSGRIDWSEIDAPDGVRVASGATVLTDDHRVPVVVDDRWWAQAVDPGVLVIGPDSPEGAALLADVLDLPTVSEELTAEPVGAGEYATADDTAAVLFTAETGRPVHGEVRVYDDLRMAVSRKGSGESSEVRVRWWVDNRGGTHLSRRR